MNEERKKELLSKGKYSMLLGMQCERPKEELEVEKKEYLSILKDIKEKKNKYENGESYILSQINSLEYALKEYKHKELLEVEVSEEHKKLLKKMYFEGLWKGHIVSIGVDGKRPFGTSNYYSDIAEILNWELPNEDLSDVQRKKAEQLLDELPYALNKLIKSI